jgi:hypothetical protein
MFFSTLYELPSAYATDRRFIRIKSSMRSVIKSVVRLVQDIPDHDASIMLRAASLVPSLHVE